MQQTEVVIPKTGDIFDLPDISRQVIVESVMLINSDTYVIVYPISYFVPMACDEDFVFFIDVPFMAEAWNCLTLPLSAMTTYKGTLDPRMVSYFSAFILSQHSGSLKKVTGIDIMSGPPIKSSTDIRNMFQLQEKEIFSDIRNRFNPLKRKTK